MIGVEVLALKGLHRRQLGHVRAGGVGRYSFMTYPAFWKPLNPKA